MSSPNPYDRRDQPGLTMGQWADGQIGRARSVIAADDLSAMCDSAFARGRDAGRDEVGDTIPNLQRLTWQEAYEQGVRDGRADLHSDMSPAIHSALMVADEVADLPPKTSRDQLRDTIDKLRGNVLRIAGCHDKERQEQRARSPKGIEGNRV